MPEKSTAPRRSTASDAAFLKAKQVMPGGVSSPVRAFGGVGGTPVFLREGDGCHVVDVDGNRYVDYVASYGPLIVGHANERVVAALSKAIGRGTSFGAPTELETQLASTIINAFPASIEMVRFVNSGTEAAMSAIRLARAATGRDLIVKTIGGYHGHVDGLLVDAGSGALTLGHPSSPGVPKAVAGLTIGVPYNDANAVRAAFEKFPGQIAAVAVEPVAGNMGVVPPEPGYLQSLREFCTQHGALLVFDEVMTGFRVAWGGAQVRFGIKPDLTILGKVIGGGLPCAAYAGPRSLMELVSPVGKVYQAGTLSGNPLAMSAGLSTLEILREPGVYESLEETSATLADGLTRAAADANVPVTVTRCGTMVGLFFTTAPGQPVRNYTDATAGHPDRYATFFHAMLNRGVYLAPSMYEALFVGTAHTPDAIAETLAAARESFKVVAEG
ncbi:MAG TPA: glutamate-1-semialdehyde 2,1-aminomutase [Tepidisphaeraceae bacterium]|nr:glutamate-1-semialdehyde 2,1-aminomutase [Tepidisphaeraceae bacterium]